MLDLFVGNGVFSSAFTKNDYLYVVGLPWPSACLGNVHYW